MFQGPAISSCIAAGISLCIRPWVGVEGSGIRDQGSWFRVQGAGFKVRGSGLRVQGSGFRVQGPAITSWSAVEISLCTWSGVRFRLNDFGFQVYLTEHTYGLVLESLLHHKNRQLIVYYD